jgi:hypothetical protein
VSPPAQPDAAWPDDHHAGPSSTGPAGAGSNGGSSWPWRAEPHDLHPAPGSSPSPLRSEPHDLYARPGSGSSSAPGASPGGPLGAEPHDIYARPGSGSSIPTASAGRPARSEPHDLYDEPGAGVSFGRASVRGNDPHHLHPPPAAGGSTGGGGWSVPPERAMPAPGPTAPDRQVFVPPPDTLPDPGPPDPPGGWGLPQARPAPVVPPTPRPVQGPPRHARPRQQTIDRRRLAVVYDIEGPRVRLGIAWFAGAMAATVVSPITTALVYAAVAGMAARQIVKAWGSVSWQADVAAGLGALPVLAALVGPEFAALTLIVVGFAAVGCAAAPDGARLPGSGGRLAAAGILCLSAVPALGAAAFVLVRSESVVAAVVLLGLVSAYEAGDYIVGSGASNPLEGPLAGITASTLLALPLALVLVEPFDAAGVILLAFTAVACPLGQIVASAALPGAGAYAPALRRIDTLLILAPLWAAAAGAF